LALARIATAAGVSEGPRAILAMVAPKTEEAQTAPYAKSLQAIRLNECDNHKSRSRVIIS
jgi:hypothetical protein